MQTVVDPRLPFWPSTTTESLRRDATLVLASTGLVALCAHISLPLPFTPVPITLQTFAVVLLGIFLKPTLSSAAMLLYLAEGLAGIPVFSPHGVGGAAQLFGPTGGFLLSYPAVSPLAGKLVRSLRTSCSAFWASLAGGTLAIIPAFVLGSSWLALQLHLSAAAAWHLAVAPFLPGEAIKLLTVAGFFASVQRLRRS